MNPRLIRAVCDCEFFRGLSREASTRIAELSQPRSLARRETLFLEHARGGAIFLLVEGRIGLTKTTPAGEEVVIRTIKPGEVFAEVILFEQDRYPVTATALTSAEVLAFARGDILHLLDDRTFRNDFMKMLMRKQRYLAERVHFLTAYDVDERFAIFLKEQYGESPTLTPAMSKKDFAAALGTTPETFSRLLQRLKKKKLLEWKGRVVRVQPSFWKGV